MRSTFLSLTWPKFGGHNAGLAQRKPSARTKAKANSNAMPKGSSKNRTPQDSYPSWFGVMGQFIWLFSSRLLWGVSKLSWQIILYIWHYLSWKQRLWTMLVLTFFLSLMALKIPLINHAFDQTRANAQSLANNLVRSQQQALGITLNDISLKGRQFMPAASINQTLGLKAGQALSDVDTQRLLQQLRQLGWIEHVTLERHWPHSLVITIKERQPSAIWQVQGVRYLIDDKGALIAPFRDEDSAQFSQLPYVVGKGAPHALTSLTAILEAMPVLQKDLESASFIGERRWRLRLSSGTMLELPEANPVMAIQNFMNLVSQQQLDFSKWEIVDLRLNDRIIFTPADSSSPSAKPL